MVLRKTPNFRNKACMDPHLKQNRQTPMTPEMCSLRESMLLRMIRMQLQGSKDEVSRCVAMGVLKAFILKPQEL